MYHSDGLKMLNLDFTISYCSIFYSIIFIAFCSVNHLKFGKVYQGYSFASKFFKMAAHSSTKSELRVNSKGGFELSPLMPETQSEIDILSIINCYLVKS